MTTTQPQVAIREFRTAWGRSAFEVVPADDDNAAAIEVFESAAEAEAHAEAQGWMVVG